MLILGLILFGLLVGAAAQWILGTGRAGVDWARALVAGLAGSFVGGAIGPLFSGDGVGLTPSGLIESLVGALIVTALWHRATPQRSAR